MPTTLFTRSERREGTEILLVTGEIDLATAPRLGLAIEAALTDDAPLVVDMTGVGFLDSSGARALALADGMAVARGGRLLLVPSERVSQVFEIANLESLFHVYAALGEAVEAARGIAARGGSASTA
jgi:anti-sigma B factor antagonist